MKTQGRQCLQRNVNSVCNLLQAIEILRSLIVLLGSCLRPPLASQVSQASQVSEASQVHQDGRAMEVALRAAQAYVAPTEHTFYISADAAELSWDQIDRLSELRKSLRPQSRSKQEFPGLNLSGQGDGGPDSSFVMVGIASTLKGGNEEKKTFDYYLWTQRTRSLAEAVRDKAQAMMDDARSQLATEPPNVFLAYTVKVIDWTLNNKAYIGMLQGWMLVSGMSQSSIGVTRGSGVVQIVVPQGQGLGSDMNTCMHIFLHNTAAALKLHGFEACGKRT